MGEPIAEVGYLAGACGHDGSDWIKALIDAAGHLQIDVVDSGGADLKDVLDKLSDILTELNAKLETADLASATTRYINTYPTGRIGGAWQKQPLIWGVSDSVAAAVTDENLGAGSQDKQTTAIPEGEIHVVSTMAFRIDSGSCTRADLNLYVDGVVILLKREEPPTSGTWYLHTGEFVLAKDDYVYVSMTGLTAGDNLYLRYAAYRMDIDL